MKTNYPFLQKWKQAEKKNSRPINRTNIMIMGGAPLSGAQPPPKSQFTGYGEDGQLQPENPVEMVNTQNGQKLIHEGEVKIQYPDGTTTVIPAKDLPQDKLRKMQEKGMQGFQAGGSFKARGPWPGPNPIPTPPPAKNPLGNQQAKDYTINPISGGHDPVSPLGALGIPKMSPDIKQGIGGMSPDIKQGIGGMSPDIKKGIGGSIPDPLTPPDVITPQPITGAVQTTLPDIPGANVLGQAQPGPDFQKSAVAPVGAQGQFPFAKDVPQAKQIGGPVAPIKPDIGEPPLTEDELKYQQTLQKLTKLSEGESELDKKIREEERARFKGEEQAGKGSLEQQLSQLGMTGREALLERAMAGRGFAAQEAEVISNLRKGQADRAFQASMALPGATLAGMKFELDKKQWEQMSEFEKEKWMTEKDQWNKMFDLGKEKWDYGKKLDMVQTLMQQGGADNFSKASDMLEAMFGQSVDFSNALNAENQGNFFAGMDLISSSLASGLDWDATMKALEQGGLLDQMGMTESDVKGMYDNMKLQSDPLYQAMQMTDQWVEQGFMTQDEADDFMAMVKHGLTNQDDFDISDGFGVYDDKGNEVGFFKTQEEADAFIADNADKGYSSKEVKNHIEPITPTPTPTPTPISDTSISDFLGREPTPEELALFGDEDNFDMAESFLKDDYDDYSVSDMGEMKKFYDKLPEDWQNKHKFSDIIENISPQEATIARAFEDNNVISDVDGKPMEDWLKGDWSKWTKSGRDHWVFKDDMKNWLGENKGKYVKFGNKVLLLKSYNNGTGSDRNSYPTITFQDPVSKKNVIWRCKDGDGRMSTGNSSNKSMSQYLGLDSPVGLYDMFQNDFWGNDYLSYAERLY